MQTLALIPARSGSKSIPLKNIASVAGQPLIAYTIAAALRAKNIDRVVVSTDSLEIASIAQSFGAEAPFIRPPELAEDDTSSIEVVLHALEWLEQQESYSPDYLMLLQPTSPLRTVEDLELALQLAQKVKADTVVSVCSVKQHPYWTKSITTEGKLTEFIHLQQEQIYNCRQSLPSVYALNGSIYIAKPQILLEKRTFYTDQTYAYIMPPERSLDIDTPWDLYLADLILKNKQLKDSSKAL